MTSKHAQSARGALIARRTYCRPLDESGTRFENWTQVVERVIGHQRWLWEAALGSNLSAPQEAELKELGDLMLNYEGMLAGRTLWLGGTEISRTRTASTLNCTHKVVRSVHDAVDLFWLLLQGAGTGFTPEPGTLNGFANPMKVECVRSQRTVEEFEGGVRGCEYNIETFSGGVWTIKVGDSASAWAKLIGKILAGKFTANTLVIDMSEIRAKGIRLKGYGWISSGDGPLARAMVGICKVMNRRAGQLLTKMDLLDVMNWLGTTLSSRRSAQIALVDAHDPEAEAFASAKKDYWSVGNDHRASSNNSLVFWSKPGKSELRGLFAAMMDAGGSEPGFINGAAARKRAPWFSGVNPCAEQLLGDGGVCNLSEVVLPRFNGRFPELQRAVTLIARANYRQTCINMDDGILQRTWHELNQFLHLCGVGVTGVVQWDLCRSEEAWRALRSTAHEAGTAMADELSLPHPKHITTLKPSGTLSKLCDVSEGIHAPLGRYIFNNTNFGSSDPLVEKLRAANYQVTPNPLDPEAVLVRFPVEFPGAELVNTESAVSQLERYKLLMLNYVDSNASNTISYSPAEVPEIVDWLHENWDVYVGVSFIYRTDPTKTAQDLGYAYLPQEVVTEETFRAYADTLLPVDLDSDTGEDLIDEACAGGACPVR